MSFAKYDTTKLPYVICKISDKVASEQEFDAALNGFVNLLKGKRQFLIFCDLTEAAMPKMGYFKKILPIMENNKSDIEKNLIASAIITSNTFIEGGFNFLFTIKPPIKPFKAFKKMNDALLWAEKMNENHNNKNKPQY